MTSEGTSLPGSAVSFAERYSRPNGPLIRLCYVSRRIPQADDETVINVFLDASVRNFLAGVSGDVWISPKHFIQTLEGTAGTVEGIYRRICADPRHSEVTCVARSRIAVRSFVRPMSWNSIREEKWGVVGVPVVEETLGLDEACEQLILRGPASNL